MFGLKSNIAQKLTELSSQIKEVEPRVRRVAGTTLLASNIARIHNEGKAVDDSRIGSYSTKPAYFSPERSPKKFTPKGKNGKSKFANGKRKKTRYFSNGYKMAFSVRQKVNTIFSSPLMLGRYNVKGDISASKLRVELKTMFKLRKSLEFSKDIDLSGKNVLLLDDLYRSGVTLETITDILYKKAGVKDVYVLTMTKSRSKR